MFEKLIYLSSYLFLAIYDLCLIKSSLLSENELNKFKKSIELMCVDGSLDNWITFTFKFTPY